MSGVPGTLLSCSLYRNPFRHKARLRIISIWLSRGFTRDINRLRCALVSRSIANFKSIDVLFQMQLDALSNYLTEPNRHGVADMAGQGLDYNGLIGWNELVIYWERLDQCCFAK